MDISNPLSSLKSPATSDRGPCQKKSPAGDDTPLIERVLSYAEKKFFTKNKEIPIQENDTQTLFYVRTGTIEVYQSVGATKIVVALIGGGNFFGEIGFFDGVSRVRNIRVTDDAEICIITVETMARLQEENPPLYAAFLAHLTRSICAKFRRILEESEPLIGYAASLSTGRHGYRETAPIPSAFLATPAWNTVHRKVEQCKADLFNFSYRLQHETASSSSNHEENRNKLFTFLDKFNALLLDLNAAAYNQEEEDCIWGYVFKEFFPYFMRSRFAERAYYKPKGYAGDFQMMEMIYRNQPAGDGKLGMLVDEWGLSTAAAKAIRGRRKLLHRQLSALSAQKIRQGAAPVRVMNLACGANRELFDFIEECDFSNRIEALCVDIDHEALEYTDQAVNTFPHQATIRLMKENIVKWALGKITHRIPLQDIIYSSGLTDYLDNNLFLALITRCYEHLKPGGVLMIGNFSPKNSTRPIMDHILHWKLIHRDEEEMLGLFNRSPFGKNIQIVAEDQGVNIFAVAAKIDSV